MVRDRLQGLSELTMELRDGEQRQREKGEQVSPGHRWNSILRFPQHIIKSTMATRKMRPLHLLL